MTVIRSLSASTVATRALLAAGCCLALSSGVQAESQSSVRPLIGAGITTGGDRLVNITHVNEQGQPTDNSRINAGNLLQVYGGLVYQPLPRFSVQGTVGYHWHSVDGGDGSAKFSRYPVELLAQYHVNDHWRLGLGARYAYKPIVQGSFNNASNQGPSQFRETLDQDIGTILEGEYMVDRKLGLKLRYVSEKYTFQPPNPAFSVDGSHIGFLVTWYLGSSD